MKVVSRDEWLGARRELLAEEEQAAQARRAVNVKRRELPAVRIDKEYLFQGPAGKATLADLFGGRRQLIVFHFMFDPDWDEGCPHCSFQLDNIGHLAHLNAVGTSLVAVSRAQLEKIQRFKERMGWDLPWFSSYGSDFNYDFHVTIDKESARMEGGPLALEKAALAEEGQLSAAELPGLSVFVQEAGDILHTYSAYASGGDIPFPQSTFNYLDLTPLGRQEGEGAMSWVRHHDKY